MGYVVILAINNPWANGLCHTPYYKLSQSSDACTHYIQLFHQSFYHSFLHSSINSFMHSYIYSFLSSCVVSANRIDKGSTFRPDAAALRGCDLGRGLRTSMGSPEDTMGKWINHGDFEGFYGVLRYFKHQNQLEEHVEC